MNVNDASEMIAMFKWVSTRQNALSAAGMDFGAARRQAAQEYGLIQTPPISGEQVLSEGGLYMSRLSRSENSSREVEEANELLAVDDAPPSMTLMYQLWAENHDHVAPDAELAFFTGMTGAAFGFSRKKLVNAGYKFERTGYGWAISSRPIDKTYTHAEVVMIVEKAIRDVESR